MGARRGPGTAVGVGLWCAGCLLGSGALAVADEASTARTPTRADLLNDPAYDPRANPWVTREQRAAWLAAQKAREAAAAAQRAAEEARMQQVLAAEQARLDQAMAAEERRLQAEMATFEAARLREEEAMQRQYAAEEQRALAEMRRFEEEQARLFAREAAAEQRRIEAQIAAENRASTPPSHDMRDEARRIAREEAARLGSAYGFPERQWPGAPPPADNRLAGPDSQGCAVPPPDRELDPGPSLEGGTGIPCPSPNWRRRTNVRLDLEGYWGSRSDPNGSVGSRIVPIPMEDLNWNALSFDSTFGGRMNLRIGRPDDAQWEFRAFYLGEHDDRANVSAATFAYHPSAGAPPVILGPHDVVLEADSTLVGGSVAWRPPLSVGGSTRLDAILGLEVIHFSESATAHSFSPGFGFGPSPLLAAESETWLAAAVVGLGYEADISSRFTLEVGMRALVGAAIGSVDVEERAVFAADARRDGDEATELAWGMHLDAALVFRLSDRVSLRLGYGLLFADGFADAYEALDLGDLAAGVRARATTTDLLMHGIAAGVSLDL